MDLPYVKHKARSWALWGGGQGVHDILLSLRRAELESLQEFIRQPLRFQILSISVCLSGILFQPSRPGEPQSMKLIVPMPALSRVLRRTSIQSLKRQCGQRWTRHVIGRVRIWHHTDLFWTPPLSSEPLENRSFAWAWASTVAWGYYIAL